MKMIVKPKSIELLLINGGSNGFISLHPNQKWKVETLQKDENTIALEHKFVHLKMSKEMFNEHFKKCD